MTATVRQVNSPTASPWPLAHHTSVSEFTVPPALIDATSDLRTDVSPDHRAFDELTIWRRSGAIDGLMGLLTQFAESSATEIERSATADDAPPQLAEIVEMASGGAPDLRDALRDLDGAKQEAEEDGFPTPSDVALKNARRLLHAMYEISPRRFEVYPGPDGEIAIDAPGGFGRSVLLLCDSDGSASCLVNMEGTPRRARYANTFSLPDGFVREALSELERRSDRAA